MLLIINHLVSGGDCFWTRAVVANCNINVNFVRIVLLNRQREWRIVPEKRRLCILKLPFIFAIQGTQCDGRCIWPLGLIMEALTANDTAREREQLVSLHSTATCVSAFHSMICAPNRPPTGC